MKICLYSPYVPKHIGGGEKYFFDVAKSFVEMGHDVFVGVTHDLDEKLIRQKYEQFLNYSLEGVKFISTPLNTPASFWQKLLWTKQWDVLYYATDGSLFFSLAKRNILHIQIPFSDPKSSFVDRLKLMNWSVKNTNSGFTKQAIEKYWHTKVDFVHYPMINPPAVSADLLAKKEKIILHVGRFFRQLHSKRQDVLVDIFKKLLKAHPKETKEWQLVLVGSVEDFSYANEVKKAAAGFPIKIVEVSHKQLWEYYQRASIYWHATGFGLDEAQEPAKMEHFGISTVEAMSMGCVPIVIGQGGQVEVVGPILKELLWKTEEECLKITLRMITDPKLRQEKAELARRRAQRFDQHQFRQTLAKMISTN